VLITANRDVDEALVEALVERGTMRGDEVDDVIAHQIALRGLRLERERRLDWERRRQSAASFVAAPSSGK
jgi:hypothetical protein